MDDMRQFFGCYFHQDWNLEYASYDDAIADFSEGASKEQLQSVLNFVVEILEGPDVESFDMTEHGGFYAPARDGISNKVFLTSIKNSIISTLS